MTTPPAKPSPNPSATRSTAGAVTVGIGAAPGPDDLVLVLGSRHPSAHGLVRLRLTLDGDRVTGCEPVVGHVHRGAEKLFEVRDYRQVMVLANRHDWLAAFSSELGVALAVERMLGLEVPVRATWARTLLAELNRVLSHLVFLAAVPAELGGRPVPGLVTCREAVQAVMEELTGGRVHFMFNRVGGLLADVPAGWPGRVATVLSTVRAQLPRVQDRLLDDPGFRERTTGVGVLPAALVDAHGVSGPIARASGVALDLRRDEPYLAYADLLAGGALEVVTRSEGDAHARHQVLLDQVAASLTMAEACLDRLATVTGPVGVRLPKVVRAPEGTTYAWTENPLGINGYYLVSRGEKTAWRLKLRSASFGNVSALPAVVTGCRVADLLAIVSSWFYVVGDIDR